MELSKVEGGIGLCGRNCFLHSNLSFFKGFTGHESINRSMLTCSLMGLLTYLRGMKSKPFGDRIKPPYTFFSVNYPGMVMVQTTSCLVVAFIFPPLFEAFLASGLPLTAVGKGVGGIALRHLIGKLQLEKRCTHAGMNH